MPAWMLAAVLTADVALAGRIRRLEDGSEGGAKRDPPVEAPAPVEAPWIEAAGVLLDDGQPAAARIEAASRLGVTGDPRVLPFLKAAATLDGADVRLAALAAAGRFDHEGATAIGVRVATDARLGRSTRLAAVALLRDLSRKDAGEALWALAHRRQTSAVVRSAAATAFSEGYPELAQAMASPVSPDGPGGTAAGIAAQGVVGGVLFSSIGAWGQLESGVAIGATGGSAIGLGTGWWYAATQPVSDGQGLAYASAVGWGTSVGLLGQWAALPPEDPRISPRQRRDVGALLRMVGTGSGAAAGAAFLRRDPDPTEVIEVDLAGYTGSQLGWGLSLMALRNRWELIEVHGNSLGLDLALARNTRVRTASTLGGALAGLGAGLALRRAWDLEPGDALLGAVFAVEGATTAAFAIDGFRVRATGLAYTGLHLGLALGLAASALEEGTPERRAVIGAYGGFGGHLLGAGIGWLAAPRDSKRGMAAATIPLGLAGAVAGAAFSERLDPDLGDWTLIGVGASLTTAQTAATVHVLNNRLRLRAPETLQAWIPLTAGASAVGLMALAPAVKPDPGELLLVGAAAGWGTWFGAAIPYAVGADLRPGDDVLVAMVTADVFLVGGAALVSPLVDLEPKRTLGAQLGGLAGGTLGALSAGLASNQGQVAVGGAVIGSVLGLGAGALVSETVRRRDSTTASTLHLPAVRLRLPGVWSPLAQVVRRPDGGQTMVWGVQSSGW